MPNIDIAQLLPFEAAIEAQFAASATLKVVSGPYPEWKPETYAMPFCLMTDTGGGGALTRGFTSGPYAGSWQRQFNFFGESRALVVSYINAFMNILDSTPLSLSSGKMLQVWRLGEPVYHYNRGALYGVPNQDGWVGEISYRFRILQTLGSVA